MGMKYHERAKAIFASPWASPSERLVLLALSHHMDGEGVAYPSLGTIATYTGMDQRSARRIMRALEAKGAVVPAPRTGSRTTYRAVWSSIADPGHTVLPHPGHTVPPDPMSPRTYGPPTPDPMSPHPGHTVPQTDQGTDQGTDPLAAVNRADLLEAETTPQPEPEPDLPGWLRNPPRGATPPAVWLDREGGGNRTAGRLALWDALARVVEATRGKVRRDSMATDARALLGLLRELDWPSLPEWTEDAILVAGAMQTCPHPMFARDVRAIGWDGGVDRRHSVSTLVVHRRWADRLAAARAWVAAGGVPGVDAAADAKWRQIHAWANRPTTQDQALRTTEENASGPLSAGLRAIGGIDRLRQVPVDDMPARRAWSLAYTTAEPTRHAGAA